MVSDRAGTFGTALFWSFCLRRQDRRTANGLIVDISQIIEYTMFQENVQKHVCLGETSYKSTFVRERSHFYGRDQESNSKGNC